MKRWIWLVVIIIVLGGALVTWRAFSMSVEHRPDVAATPDMVKRGEYLVQAGDCISCHTAPGNAAFAGGREFNLGSLGKLYSPNLTPDKDTGIGSWSDDDFRAALQLGIGKGGVHLYPAFPFASFSMLTDEDALAIKAYLFSLKPVHNIPPDNAMSWPYNQRWLMAYWSWMFDANERFKPDSAQSAAWNRGKYLVEGLGHCGECHTPRNLLQARKSSDAYAGAVAQSWKAYNISPDKDTGIGSWTDDALVSYLSTGVAEGHGPASGPMAEAVSNSFRFMTSEDIHAMVAYLKSVKAVSASAPSLSTSSGVAVAATTDPALAFGAQVYAGLCANCHRRDGSESQTPYDALKGSHSVADHEAINLTQIVLYGSTIETAYGRINMPAFGKVHTDAEIAAVVNYVTGQLGGHSAGVTAEDVHQRR